jgi:hypothetical protein
MLYQGTTTFLVMQGLARTKCVIKYVWLWKKKKTRDIRHRRSSMLDRPMIIQTNQRSLSHFLGRTISSRADEFFTLVRSGEWVWMSNGNCHVHARTVEFQTSFFYAMKKKGEKISVTNFFSDRFVFHLSFALTLRSLSNIVEPVLSSQ